MPASPEQTSATFLPCGGELEGVADAGLFVAEREAVLGLAELEVGDEIEIEAVADPVGGGSRARRRRRCADRLAGADADDVQTAAGAAEAFGIERSGARPMAQVARLILCLGDDQSASGPAAASAAASATPGVPTSASTIVGGVLQATRFGVELGGGEEASGTPKCAQRHGAPARRP